MHAWGWHLKIASFCMCRIPKELLWRFEGLLVAFVYAVWALSTSKNCRHLCNTKQHSEAFASISKSNGQFCHLNFWRLEPELRPCHVTCVTLTGPQLPNRHSPTSKLPHLQGVLVCESCFLPSLKIVSPDQDPEALQRNLVCRFTSVVQPMEEAKVNSRFTAGGGNDVKVHKMNMQLSCRDRSICG